jgi:hypothetical protein
MISPPVISDCPSYQKPENGEGRRQPRPEAAFVGPSNAVTARLIVAVRIGGVRHVPFHSWLASSVDKQIAGCPECSCARAMYACSMGYRFVIACFPYARPSDGARRFLGHEGLLQSKEIAIVEQPDRSRPEARWLARPISLGKAIGQVCWQGRLR